MDNRKRSYMKIRTANYCRSTLCFYMKLCQVFLEKLEMNSDYLYRWRCKIQI